METGRNRTETVRFPKRIGMIVPSSNTVVEPICSRIFFGMEDVVTVHYSRLEVVNVSLDDNSTRQFAVDTMLRAADQLAQAKVDAIIWNGTAGSWLGIERDREMCQKIEEKTKIPMSTASLGLVGSYQDFDIKRLHLVTPYIKEMNDVIIREYEKLGLTAAGVTGLGITENTEIGSVTKEQLETLCCSTGAGHGEGIAVVCTNLAAAWRADLIEKRSGAVVFDSVTAAVREALKLCGLEKLSFQGWGKLLDV